MYTFIFDVEGQIIKRNDCEQPVAKCRNLFKAKFNFKGEEWSGIKTALFMQGSYSKSVVLDENDTCIVPWEFFDSEYVTHGYVSVFCGDFVTANSVEIKILKSGYQDSDASVPPTPDIYQQILERLEQVSGITPEDLAKAVEDYLAKNPIESTPIDKTLTQEGQAADAKATGEKIAEKIDKNQGVENKGKALVVGEDGDVVAGQISGSVGEMWRLLRTVTIPQNPKTDQSGVVWKLNDSGDILGFAFDTDENGENFSLDDVRWYGKTNMDIKIDDENRDMYLTSINKIDINLYRMTIKSAHSLFGYLNRTVDRLYPLEYTNVQYEFLSKIICGTGNSAGGIVFNKRITAFGFLNTNNIFKEGTVFHVYGKE